MDHNQTGASSVSTSMSRGDLEAIIAGIWSEVLGLDHVGLHDNFLLLGGESLLATQVVSQIRRQLGCEIPIRSIFVSTVAEVATEVGAVLSTGAGAPGPPRTQPACVSRT